MFENLKLRQRILLGYLAPLLLLLCAMVVVYVNMREMARSSEEHDIKQEIMLTAQGLTLDTVKMQRSMRGYLLKKNADSLRHYQDAKTAYKNKLEWLQRNMKDPQQLDTLRRINELAQAQFLNHEQLMALAGQDKQAVAISQYVSSQDAKIGDELESNGNILQQQEAAIVKTLGETEEADIRIVTNIIVYGMLATIVLSVALALWLAAVISRRIIDSATQLSAASNEIAATVAQHERTASQQAAAVNETSATIDELSASSRQSAEQAANSAGLADRSNTATMEGSETTQQAVEAMSSLKDKIVSMADQILHLGEQSGQIGSIAVLLKDLAGQINMLALNAAVEAARAGEHGKGFAVVAGEIRKLADQSKKSAEQTAVLVADIQKATNSSIMVTEDSTRTVNEVTKLVQKVADLFANLASLAGGVNENAQQMMLNTKQQVAAFSQVVQATNSIAAGAKETAAGIGQTKVGVQNLNNAAEKLKAMV
mgnify:CR=1 FL=1